MANFLDRNGQIGPNNEQIWRQKWTNLGQNGQIWAKMGKFGVEMDQIQLWAQKKSNFSHFGAKFYTMQLPIPILRFRFLAQNWRQNWTFLSCPKSNIFDIGCKWTQKIQI